MYEVIRTIATSHQSVVELGRHPEGHLVALKRIHIEGGATERAIARQRIRREAEVLASLQVPGVIELLDVFDDDGETVLVMPYLAGGSLAARVNRSGPIASQHIGELAVPLLTALAAMHRRGIVHRDIKPSNILFDDHDRPHLADFGISATRDFTPGLTADGLVVGTPAYLAPERARGEPASPAADIYSLGASLRFAVSGMPPHGIGDLMSNITRAASARVEPLPESIEAPVAEALAAMCRLEPTERPSAAELVDGPEGTVRFVPASHHATTVSHQPSPSLFARRCAQTAKVAAVGVVLVLIGALIGTVGGSYLGTRSQSAAADQSAMLGDLLTDPADESIPSDPDPTTTTMPPTTTTTCVPLPFQPCGDPQPAPNTDGRQCLDGYYNHDLDPLTGCEAEADDIDDTPLTARARAIEGTIIPFGDVDKVLVPVNDRFQLLCDGVLTLTLSAPEGINLEMVVFNKGTSIGTARTGMGGTEALRLPEPSCGRDDSTVLEVVIRAVEGRSSEPWRLERSGSW